jgi:enamine deaminase RidA (YjgF/YER057c/UK114 family)
MDDATVLNRLAELDAELPTPTAPVAAYIPCVVSGSLAFVAGQVPMLDGHVLAPGVLGNRVSVEEGAGAARRAALQALAVLRDGLGGSFAQLRRIAQVTVYVAATPDFVDQPKVANGASELLVAALGQQGAHARVAIGVASLPLGASVELALTAEVDPGG